MKIKKIECLNWVNDILGVSVILENDASYLIEVAILQSLSILMEKVESDFVLAGYPYIIGLKLVDKIIQTATPKFIDANEDLYWLKLYYIILYDSSFKNRRYR